MRVHVVSDVHGAAEALARAGDGADALVCLGDLVLFLDYADHSRGIFPDLFGVENADRMVELRTARRFEEARALDRELWAGLDRRTVIERAVRKQYAELFAAFPTPTYATYGNVDIPAPVAGVRRARHHRARRRHRGDRRPGLRLRRRRPAHRDAHPVRGRRGGVRRQGRRPRPGRRALLAHPARASPSCATTPAPGGSSAAATPCSTRCARSQPKYALFGHVHQPLVARTRIGRTECVNVGHFNHTRTPWALQW